MVISNVYSLHRKSCKVSASATIQTGSMSRVLKDPDTYEAMQTCLPPMLLTGTRCALPGGLGLCPAREASETSASSLPPWRWGDARQPSRNHLRGRCLHVLHFESFHLPFQFWRGHAHVSDPFGSCPCESYDREATLSLRFSIRPHHGKDICFAWRVQPFLLILCAASFWFGSSEIDDQEEEGRGRGGMFWFSCL